jgi:photosystem II stability/assembly factor-like uncharacterized protein
MRKKPIAFTLLVLILIAFLLAGTAELKAAAEVRSLRAVLPAGAQISHHQYLPVAYMDFANWSCYPDGGAGCPGATLHSFAMVSVNEGWAVGDGGAIVHYLNGVWQAVDSPTNLTLRSVAMASTSEGWAVGGDYNYPDSLRVILHYTAGVWHIWEEANSPFKNILYSVTMISEDEGWAVGMDGNILHYVSGDWYALSSPVSADLYSVAMVSASEGWVVGDTYFTEEGVEGSIILHYAQGIWDTVSSPTSIPLNSVTMVSASEGWVVRLTPLSTRW